VAEKPALESRTRRLIAYILHNRDQLVVDTAIVLTWLLVSAALFRRLALPPWLHYLVFFVGIVAYAWITPDWERPYSDPGTELRQLPG